MLHPRTAVEVDVLVDLAATPPLGRLVDGELDPPRPPLHHLRHQRRILGGDVLVVEGDELLEAEDGAVEIDPLVHPPLLDVAHDVVDGEEAGGMVGGGAVALRVDGDVAGGEGPVVAVAVDEGVGGVAVGADRGVLVDAMLVLERLGPHHPDRPALHGEVVGEAHVVDREGDVGDAVAVQDEARRLGVVRPQGRLEDERDPPLAEHVAGLVLHLRLEPGVGHHLEAVGVAVEEGRLAGVAHEEADVVDLAEGNVAGGRHRSLLGTSRNIGRSAGPGGRGL